MKETYDTEPTEVDQVVFATLVPPDHSLRRVQPCLDCERCRALVQDGDSPAMGRAAADPVRRLTRAFLPCHAKLSDREVIAAAQVNVALRCLRDRSLESRVPVPSWLTPCRRRVGVDRQHARVDHVVTPARAQGLVRDRRRLTEATPVLANSAGPSTLRLVAQTRQRLLAAARPEAPARVAAAEADTARLRPAPADRTDVARVAPRVAPLRAMVAWADGLQQDLRPRLASPDQARRRVEAAWALAHRVLAARPRRSRPGRPGAQCGRSGGPRWHAGHLC